VRIKAERDLYSLLATHDLRAWHHNGNCAGLLLDVSFETATDTDTDWRVGDGEVTGPGSGTEPSRNGAVAGSTGDSRVSGGAAKSR
jgi:hypothetical protein